MWMSDLKETADTGSKLSLVYQTTQNLVNTNDFIYPLITIFPSVSIHIFTAR